MDGLFRDLMFVGGTPLDSINETLSSFEYLSKSCMVSHNKPLKYR